MGEVPLSLHISAETNRRLEEEAELQHVSADEIAREAIRWYIEEQERERAVLRQRVAEADTKGEFISGEAMLRWMADLETDIDAPAPAPDIFVSRG
jgi:predicted transcriptional regulator